MDYPNVSRYVAQNQHHLAPVLQQLSEETGKPVRLGNFSQASVLTDCFEVEVPVYADDERIGVWTLREVASAHMEYFERFPRRPAGKLMVHYRGN
jgi:hypothetical protein